MGLDMYLSGEKFFMHNWKNPEQDIREDGFRLERKILELGYWRKHPNLHGYIVREFAGGEDDCRQIYLDIDSLKKILKAVRMDELPHTEGFFFGESREEDREPTIEILEKAIEWLEVDDESLDDDSNEGRRVLKSVYYQASW